MRFFKILLVLLIVAGIAGVVHMQRQKQGAAEQTVLPERKDIIEAVYATGEVEPLSWLQVSPQITARFDDILVDDGAAVEKGQLLAKADDSVERAKLEEFEAHLAQMKNEYDRNKGLLDKGYISQKAFDDSISSYNELQSRIENQKLFIERMSLRSPIAGTVLRRDIEPGEVKVPGQTVFWVGDAARLRITAEVDEEDILKVKNGMAALIKTDAIEGAVLEGEVNDITPKGDPVNKNFRVRIALPQDTPLRVGMTVEVNIVISKTAQALVVPAEAVKDGAVWAGEERRAVKTGKTDGLHVEILDGLQEGEVVRAVAP